MGSQVSYQNRSQSLKFIGTQRLTEGIQHKLMLKLLEFDYVIEYKKGKENLAADALSRRDVPDSQCHAITTVIPDWLDDIKQSSIQDPESSALLNKLAADVSAAPHFTLQSGIIKYKSRIYVGAATSMRQTFIGPNSNSK